MATGADRRGPKNRVIYLGPDGDLADRLRPYLAHQGVGLDACKGVAEAAAMLGGASGGLLLVDTRTTVGGASTAPDLVASLIGPGPDGPRQPWVCIADAGDLTAHLAALRGGARAWYTSLPSLPDLSLRLVGLLGLAKVSPYRVLVVDDRGAAAVHAGGILNRAGMVVRTVFDPLTVLSALAEFRPDLMVIGLRMPGVNGVELTRVIREHDEFFALPIVILSGEADCDRQTEALRCGADEFLAKPVEPNLLIQAVRRSIERARSVHERHVSAAPRDLVTGLWSRGYLLQRIDRAIADGAERDPGQGVIFINVDPGGGLDALRRAGTLEPAFARIAQVLRAETASTDIAARVGRRSLAILVRSAETGLVEDCAERLRQAIGGTSFSVGGSLVALTVSIGIALFQPAADDAVTMISRARMACAKSRQAGGDRVVTYTPTFFMGAGSSGSARLEKLIREALHGEGLHLLYHPIVSLRQRRGQRYEAVLRLRAPDGELLMPFDFLPAAAKAGLMPLIDRWVLSRALDDTLARHEAQPGLVLMVRQTLETAANDEWVPWLRDQVARRDLIRNRPVLIFDADDVQANLETAKACFDSLKRLGIGLCLNPMDETPGALSALEQLPWSMVRLRREALSGMGIARLTSLVEAVHGHDALVIATGIEDPADIARVWGCGVDFIQGYFIKTAGETLDFDFSGTELL